MEQTRNRHLLTPDEASKLLSVPKTWIYRASSDGKFPAGVAIHVGKYLRLDQDLLLAWLKGEGEK